MKQEKNLSIIVVEDNLFYQQLIAKQLESISSIIHFFTNGEDCIEGLGQCKPDVIVMDNNLAGEMNGLETLKAIRLIESDIYVVLFSTDTELDTFKNQAYYGDFDYVHKNDLGFKNLKTTILERKVV